MRSLRAWLIRTGALLGGARRDRDIDAELASHLQLHIDDNIHAGMSPEAARRDALLHLGGVTQTRERYRERRRLPLFDTLRQDLAHALRGLRKNPGFAATAIVTLALGIGATTAIFSLLDAVLLRSLPYADADQLAYIWAPNARFADVPSDAFPPSNADFFDLRRDMRTFASLTMFDQRSFNMVAHGDARRVGGSRVTGTFFATLGVSALLGRTIDQNDDHVGHESVAVISHTLWQSEFGGDVDVLRSSIRLDGRVYQIVGVAPASFTYPHESDLGQGAADTAKTDVWLPFALAPGRQADRTIPDAVAAVGRLAPGTSVAGAQAEMTALFARLDALHAPDYRGSRPFVKSFVETAVGDARPLLRLLLGAVVLVLLVACGNAAHLLLARGATRRHEMSVRVALGAGRWDLVRHALAEALLLACAGGASGVAVAAAALRALRVLDPGNIPRLNETTLDGRVLLFTVITSLVTGIACGVLPALITSRVGVDGLLRPRGAGGETTSSSAHIREALIVAELATAVMLLVGAGVLLHSYVKLRRVNPGFSPSTQTMRIALDARFRERVQRVEFFKRLVARVEALPGVTIAGAVDAMPLSHSERVSLFAVEGYPNRANQFVHARAITPRYFAAMKTPLIEGSSFSDDDAARQPPAVIVNQAFARMYFDGPRALGRHVRLVDLDTTRQPPWSTVIGVVADVRHSSLEASAPPQIYQSLWQADADSVYLAVRSTRAPADLFASVREAVRSLDATVAVAEFRSMDQLISNASARRRFETTLVACFAASTLMLAAIGLYGLISYSVRRRTAEIGVRMALGAQSRDVVNLVLGQGVHLTIWGLAIGTAGAFGITRLLRSLLYGVVPEDPIAFVTVALALLLTAILASYVPARRAAMADPAASLRYE